MSSLPRGAASRGPPCSSAAATTTADKHAVMVNTTRRLSVHSAHGPLGVLLCLRYCNPPLTLLTHTLSGPDTQTHSDLSQVCGFFLSLLCFFAAPPFSLLLSEFTFVFSRFRSVEQGFPMLGSPTSFYTPLNCCCSLLLLSGLEPFRLKSVIKITRECYSVFFCKTVAFAGQKRGARRPRCSLINTSRLGSARVQLGPLTTGFSSAGILGTEGPRGLFLPG